MNINEKFTKSTYICIHGNVCCTTNRAKCKDEYYFMKVTNEQVSSDREVLDKYNTLNELIAAFPGKTLPDEFINTSENIKKEV
ncbi:MAG: hypothetical protein PVF17_09745 [Ignavibacteria bacterium]|jgi:hypothetical protein